MSSTRLERQLPVEQPLQARQLRTKLLIETLIVLLLSLLRSAIYAVLSIIEKLTRPQPLNQQTTTMNNSVTPDRPWLDLSYQLTAVFFLLPPVFLAIFLLANVAPPQRSAWRALGLDARRRGRDLLAGFGLAALIGIPGLAFYLFARQIGINTNVAPANLAENWWTIPVYLLFAFGNGALEEIVVVGYLFTRWRQLRWKPWLIIVVSAVLRGSYHLYQGFGGFAGNIVMGLVFGYYYQRTKRLWPLVIAHTLIDIAAFVGYSLIAPLVDWI